MPELDPTTEERIDEPVAQEAERETLLTPAQAIEQMRINAPRGQQEAPAVLDRVNADQRSRPVARLQHQRRRPTRINDHSWVHIQIVANIALKLLRQLMKHGVEPALVRTTGCARGLRGRRPPRRAAPRIGMAVHRDRHEDLSLFLAQPKMHELLEPSTRSPS